MAGFAELIVAQIGFVGGHLLLSHPPIRGRIVRAIGESRFLASYSLAMAALLVCVILAYRGAPTLWWWDFGAAGRWVPALLMPFALALAVLGLTSKNVTAVGGERHWNAPVRGVGTITRHPFLWGAALWAVGHLAANGDAAAVILFGGMALLACVGMTAIDHKRAMKLGASWNVVAGRTSLIPFAAALSGRTAIDWAGIGWVRPVAAIFLYVALMHGHRLLFGASALPRG